jgi:hypothetical protein
MPPTARPDKEDRSFYVFLAVMLVIAVVTAVAFVVFGPPEINSL